VKAKTLDRRLKLGAPAKARVALDLGQPLAALAAAVAKHASSASGAHPAKESMDSPAVSLLGLIGAFDRASLPEHSHRTGDTVSITSSRAPCALRYPQAGVIFRARKQATQRKTSQSSTNLASRSTNSYK
jgi:hypothetical protein